MNYLTLLSKIWICLFVISCAQVVSNNFDDEENELSSNSDTEKQESKKNNQQDLSSSSKSKKNTSSSSISNKTPSSSSKESTNLDLYKIDSIYVRAHRDTIHSVAQECIIVVADDSIEFLDTQSFQFYLTDYFYIIENDTLEYYQDVVDTICSFYEGPHIENVYVNFDTVIINKQTWLSQNLFTNNGDEFCYENNSKYCSDYGALYTWEKAKSICPKGWRLPSKEDFEYLIESVGGPSKANKTLKALNGWRYGINGNNDFFFTVFPAGYRTEKGTFQGGIDENGGTETCFWSSTQDETSSGNAYCMYISLEYIDSKWKERNVTFKSIDKNSAVSVRCVMK